MKNYFLLFFIFICSINTNAKVDVHSQFITTNDGLANNSVRYLFQDSKGFIWMGTLNGVNRFDGHSFVTFRPKLSTEISLADHHIKKITEDRHGLLWFETASKIFSCYDLKRDCFVDYTGCGAYKQKYEKITETISGDIWLWDHKNGCRRIINRNGILSSLAFTKGNGRLPSNNVNFINEDNNRTLWIGTQAGLIKVSGTQIQELYRGTAFIATTVYKNKNYFITDKGVIFQYEIGSGLRHIGKIPGEYSSIDVLNHFRLKNDWIIMTAGKVWVFQLSVNRWNEKSTLNIPYGHCTIDNYNNAWISNGTGEVCYVNVQTCSIKKFRLMSYDKTRSVATERYHIVQDKRHGLIWISTFGNGLFVYNPKTEEMTHYTYQIESLNRINSDFIHSIMQDRAGNIWIGSEYSGVARLTVLNDGIIRIFPENKSLVDRSNTIRLVTRMKNDEIWVGNRSGGVYRYDSQWNLLGNENYNLSIFAVKEDKQGKLWIGTRGDGLKVGGNWYTKKKENKNSLSSNHIYDIFSDLKGRMWIGTLDGGLDLAVQQKDKYVFHHFLKGNNNVRIITEDKNKWMWVGTNNGLYIFHPDSLIKNPKNYRKFSFSNSWAGDNEILNIFCDSKGNMWIGSPSSGFSVCNPEPDYRRIRFKHYDTKDGLINNVVQSIVEDHNGKIWLGTEYGISQFDPDSQTFKNYLFSAVMLENVYLENSACVANGGRLLFGTSHGLLVIDPQKVNSQQIVSPVVFTDLKINGISVHPGGSDSPLIKALCYTDKIKLKYFQNSFSIEFSTFDYTLANKTKYVYMLTSFDKDWCQPSLLNFATYKNLSPGTYELHVKACNDSGMWGKETTLQIVIAPPYWKSTWAFIIYIILLTGIVYLTFKLIRKYSILRDNIRLEKQLTEYKLVFFTNISHEFRTPLSLINGALEKMEQSKSVSKELAYSIKIMDKSTKRMLRLINQLLEFRKMQNNKLVLFLEETDVIAFLYDIFLNFQETAESKKMKYSFLPSLQAYTMFIDKGKLDKIVYNLLSNAFKYTPTGGQIIYSVKVDEKIEKLIISVADTGISITKEKQKNLFSSFMQGRSSFDSMGIGLHLAYELASVHKGTIEYSDNNGCGSVFTVTLPLENSVYDEKDFLISVSCLEEHDTIIPANSDDEGHTVKPLNQKKILIIEDDTEIREFLKKEMSIYFKVEVEADGVSGFNRACVYDADLIICDVLMPGMNGYEVTRKLKNDLSTSHIPVILLTAMGTTENKLEGIESGADAYVTKPFSIKLLLARIIQLIEQRDKLREKYMSDPNAECPTISTSEKDKQFLDKLQAIIDEELDNPEFTMEEFASRMNLGRTAFSRKFRGLTGHTPNEYLRIMRMKQAAKLLIEGHFNVSEISYKVGINDPLYFSRCFKAQFGVSPSVYLRGKKDSVE